MRGPVFEDALTPKGFAKVKADPETGTVVWPDSAFNFAAAARPRSGSRSTLGMSQRYVLGTIPMREEQVLPKVRVKRRRVSLSR